MPEGKARLRRSQDRIIAGVCGGIAEWIGWSPGKVRLLYVLASVLTAFAGIIVYIVLWLAMPDAE